MLTHTHTVTHTHTHTPLGLTLRIGPPTLADVLAEGTAKKNKNKK